tara:strand:- start:55 stop:303 length:249 start_codon:yes stop_codon:yes gene_type:complete
MKKDDLTIDDLYWMYVNKSLEPPFKNDKGEFVNEWGELIDMERWNNVSINLPHKVKSAIHRMKKRGRQDNEHEDTRRIRKDK